MIRRFFPEKKLNRKLQTTLHTSATIVVSWAKLGLSEGLQAQHFLMTVYSSCGQSGGLSRRSPSRSTRHKIWIGDSESRGCEKLRIAERDCKTKIDKQGRGRISHVNTSTPFGMSSASRYLSARQAEPGLLAVGEHFPQGDGEHPHVRGVGEGADAETLRSTPGGERDSGRLARISNIVPSSTFEYLSPYHANGILLCADMT